MAEHYVRVPEAFSSAGGNPAHAWDKWVMKLTDMGLPLGTQKNRFCWEHIEKYSFVYRIFCSFEEILRHLL